MKEQLKYLDEEIKKKRACNDLIGMKKDSMKLRKLAHAEHNLAYEAYAYYYSTLCHYFKKENAEAIRESLSGISLCNDDSCAEAYILLSNISGVLNSEQDNLLVGLEHFLNAYYKTLAYPEIPLRHMIQNNLGTLFIKVEDFQNALKYLKESFEERRHKKIPMDEVDAVLISNITIAYAQLGQYEKIAKWQKLFEENDKDMGIPLPFLNNLLTLVYLDYHNENDELLNRHVKEILNLTGQERDANNIFQLLSFVLDVCLKKKNRDLCNQIYHKMANIVALMDNTLILARLSNQYIRLLSEFNDEKLKDALVENYQLNLQAKQEELKRGRESLALKMELKESQYQQKKIMEQNEKLRHTSELDAFTNIYHKKAFQQRVEELIKKVNRDAWGALLILDIDYFKRVNDTYGHLAGDEVILCIVDIIKQELHAGDIAGRIGGDEFSIYMSDLHSKTQILNIMNTILQRIRDIHIPKLDMTLTMSIGCYLIKNTKHSFLEIFQDCDKALYQAKAKGRNQAFLFEDECYDSPINVLSN